LIDKSLEDEPGADDRFKRGLANALRMPPKPHKPKEAAQKGDLSQNQAKDGKSGGR